MSDPANDSYLDAMKQRFEEGEADEQMSVIDDLRGEGFEQEALSLERLMQIDDDSIELDE